MHHGKNILIAGMFVVGNSKLIADSGRSTREIRSPICQPLPAIDGTYEPLILLVEFANQLRDEGKSAAEAALEAAKTRLRPITMTLICTVMSGLPLTRPRPLPVFTQYLIIRFSTSEDLSAASQQLLITVYLTGLSLQLPQTSTELITGQQHCWS